MVLLSPVNVALDPLPVQLDPLKGSCLINRPHRLFGAPFGADPLEDEEAAPEEEGVLEERDSPYPVKNDSFHIPALPQAPPPTSFPRSSSGGIPSGGLPLHVAGDSGGPLDPGSHNTRSPSFFRIPSSTVADPSDFLALQRSGKTGEPRVSGDGYAEEKGYRARLSHQQPGFLNRLFLVPKKGGTWRPVIDLSSLNKVLMIPSFRMETAGEILSSVREGEWLTSLDLTDAYFHVPIRMRCRKYLRFVVEGQIYQFAALPSDYELPPTPSRVW